MTMSYVCTVSMLFFSYLFVTAGYKKRSDSEALRHTIVDYRILPESWAKPVAKLLPVIEILAGIALLVPPLLPFAAIAVCVSLLAYTAAIAINVARGRRDLDCGCAGPGAVQLVSSALLLRNGVLLIPSCYLVLHPSAASVSLGTVGLVLSLAAASLCALIYQAINQLLSNQDKLRRIASHG